MWLVDFFSTSCMRTMPDDSRLDRISSCFSVFRVKIFTFEVAIVIYLCNSAEFNRIEFVYCFLKFRMRETFFKQFLSFTINIK